MMKCLIIHWNLLRTTRLIKLLLDNQLLLLEMMSVIRHPISGSASPSPSHQHIVSITISMPIWVLWHFGLIIASLISALWLLIWDRLLSIFELLSWNRLKHNNFWLVTPSYMNLTKSYLIKRSQVCVSMGEVTSITKEAISCLLIVSAFRGFILKVDCWRRWSIPWRIYIYITIIC